MMIYEMNGRLYESMIDAQALLSRATKHGFVRTMERSGRSDQQAARMIANAWARGKSAEQLPQTWQRRYLAHCDSLLSDGSTNLRVYDEYLFIFSAAGRLITDSAGAEYEFKKALGVLSGGACPHFDKRKADFENKISDAVVNQYICIEDLSAVMFVNGALKCASDSAGNSYVANVKNGEISYNIISKSDFSQS